MKKDSMSKFISLILRHHPEAAYIELDEHGWADVDKLIKGIKRTGKQMNMELLEEIVRTDNKQRYSFNEDKTRIRANQGHSISVDVGLKEQEPPVFLYHGTAVGFYQRIQEQGLKPMGRLYVHLSKDAETAVNVGKRHGKPIVLKIHSGDMYRDGQTFYLSENGVWLTKNVAPKYFEQINI
ncbi:MAG: RNA 2'-phosphotransferase [Lachnospiraceae bacterium]|nr:RNA 2'-phosphotransferase [Lachnospiraceae bacterium]